MPILKSAIKKLRKDKKRTKINKNRRRVLKKLIKEAQQTKSNPKILKAISFIDKMAKVHLIHENKAGHLKSRLSKLISQKSKKTEKKRPQKRRRKAVKKLT